MSRRASSSGVGPSELRRSADNSGDVIERYRLLLNSVGVPNVCFEQKSYLANFILPKAFVKLLRAFPEFEDPDRIEELLLVGVQKKFFNTIPGLKPSQFYDFLLFLKGPEGQDEIAKIHLAVKLTRRGGGYFDQKQVGLVSMFDAQRGDFVAECNDIRRDYDVRMAEQEPVVRRRLQSEKEAAINAAGKRFRPSSEMHFPTNREFNMTCWDEYVGACRIERKKPRKLDPESRDEAVRVYSDIARRRSVLKELSVGSRKEELEKWVAYKIGKFVDAEESKLARRFRGLLEIVGSQLLDEIPTGGEAGDDATDSSEQADAPGEGGIFDSVDPGNLQQDGTVAVKPEAPDEQQQVAGGGVGRSARHTRRAQ